METQVNLFKKLACELKEMDYLFINNKVIQIFNIKLETHIIKVEFFDSQKGAQELILDSLDQVLVVKNCPPKEGGHHG